MRDLVHLVKQEVKLKEIKVEACCHFKSFIHIDYHLLLWGMKMADPYLWATRGNQDKPECKSKNITITLHLRANRLPGFHSQLFVEIREQQTQQKLPQSKCENQNQMSYLVIESQWISGGSLHTTLFEIFASFFPSEREVLCCMQVKSSEW